MKEIEQVRRHGNYNKYNNSNVSLVTIFRNRIYNREVDDILYCQYFFNIIPNK